MTNKKTSLRSRPKKLAVTISEVAISHASDFYGWTKSQAHLLRTGQFGKLDIKNLIEEIESLGGSELRAFESYLAGLMLHLLKAKYQSKMRTRSGDLSIKNNRFHVIRLLKNNPGFQNKIQKTLEAAYFTGRLGAIDETRLEESVFPEKCPWTFEEAVFQDGFTNPLKKKRAKKM